MQIPLICSECGHQEWGSTERPLMNKIKLLNHASKEHPNNVARVLKYSLPKTTIDPRSPVTTAPREFHLGEYL